MRLFSRNKKNGRLNHEGQWNILRTINGEQQVEVYPDFHTARHRLGQIARDARRRVNKTRRGRRM